MKIVIRAGGSGTRLWPVSRKKNPKQFQALIDNKSLLRKTVERVRPLCKNTHDLFISANSRMIPKVRNEITGILRKNIIAEPDSRNTGPAICLESCILAKRFNEDTIVASLPSDDYISDAVVFRSMLRVAENFLKKNPSYIVTPGASSNYPDTGYSYIKLGTVLLKNKGVEIYNVAKWVEKPSVTQCKNLIKSGKYFCHTGMYVWRLGTVLDLFRKFQPKCYEVCKKMADDQGVGDYSKLDKISVETAITKKAQKIAIITSDRLRWSDLGKWHIIKDVLSPNKNLTKGHVVSVDTNNCLIYGKPGKLVAVVGLRDMAVILEDDALLVCPLGRTHDVRQIVQELERKKLHRYL